MSFTQSLAPTVLEDVNDRNGKSSSPFADAASGPPKQTKRKVKREETQATTNGVTSVSSVKDDDANSPNDTPVQDSNVVGENPDSASNSTTETSGPPVSSSNQIKEVVVAAPAALADSLQEADDEVSCPNDKVLLIAAAAEDKRPTVDLSPEVIVNYAKEAKVEFFQDQHGSVFAWIPVFEDGGSHFECLKIQSRLFRARLLELIRTRTKSVPQLSTLKQAIEILELESYRVAKKDLANRRATVGKENYIDLGNQQWNMVQLNRDGWTVEAHVEARFFRPQHMLALPDPVSGGNLDTLFDFIPAETNEEKLLLTVWLLGGLHSTIPNPILVLVGQQGSAKTTRSRRIRSLLDPSITPVLGDMEMSNLFLTFQHHAVPCFENVSSFNRREADMFCRAVTGNGVERRKLYTDSDQVLYSFRRPIIINGIDTPSTRPDFLDRCLILNCRRMDKFTTLEQLDREFEAARPKLFGAMLDLLVKTLQVLDTTPAATEFRMADFARFGRAVAIAQGMKAEDFDKAYRLNIQQQDFEILEDAPMVKLLETFAKKHKDVPWEGTADELLAKLRDVAHVSGDKNARDDLPKSARWLSSRLGELAPALATREVYIKKQPRTNAKRLWSVSSTIPVDPNAEPDDIFDVLEEAGMDLTN